MGLDIRTPIGWLFTALGLILTVFGLFSDPAIYTKSLSMNVNLGWGVVLLAFGLLMTGLGHLANRKARAGAPEAQAPKAGNGHAD